MPDGVRTHLGIDRSLCGRPVALGEGRAKVELETTSAMAADDRGLVHGGFTFGAADYAAMLAVNDPNVVLVRAEVELLLPVVVGDRVVFEARVERAERSKRWVEVTARRGEEVALRGTLLCVVPRRHVLAPREGE